MERKVCRAPPPSRERLVFFAKHSSTPGEFWPPPTLGPKTASILRYGTWGDTHEKHSKLLLKLYLKLYKGIGDQVCEMCRQLFFMRPNVTMHTMSLGVLRYWQDSLAGRTKQQSDVTPKTKKKIDTQKNTIIVLAFGITRCQGDRSERLRPTAPNQNKSTCIDQ